jgi:hypothetical protein
MERRTLKRGNRKIRLGAVQGSVIGSSSSVMFLLIGHGIVSGKNSAA